MCVIGVCSANQTAPDLVMLCGFGVPGSYMRCYGDPVAPAKPERVLGNRMEEALRRSMIMTKCQLYRLLGRPIVVFVLVLTMLSIATSCVLGRFRFVGRTLKLEREQPWSSTIRLTGAAFVGRPLGG